MKYIYLFAIACFSVCAFSQTPTRDSINFRNIRTTTQTPQQADIFAKEAAAFGINTSSNAYQRIVADVMPTLDPQTKTANKQMLFSVQEVLAKKAKGGRMSTVAGWNWYERGPDNIGGRTRAVVFDPNDAANAYKKVWAGSVSGGLWYNNNITDAAIAWTKVNDFWDNLAVSCMAYDPSNTQRFYVGTGEGFNNIDAVQGAGIFYSANGGTTWTRLANTIPTGTTLTDAFKFTQKIVVNSTGVVFAATHFGILRSTDQGGTWTFVMRPSTNTGIMALGGTDFVADLEIASDGVLYAATSSGRVIKSTDATGTTWSNITPAGVNATFRTEIGLAPSTSGATQTLYVVSYSWNNANIWFKKSVDAGVNWTNCAIPNIGISNQGWYDLILTVHPTNANALFAGAVNNSRSIDGGSTWGTPLNIHTDHHAFVFRPNTNEVVDGQDGGIYYTPDWGDVTDNSPIVNSRNKGFNVTQMYSVAAKNVNGDGYALAGSQDNGTHKMTTSATTVGPSGYVWHSDGMLCYIDQDNPNIQIVTTQNLVYGLANASGTVTQTLLNFPYGDFINPGDYDDANNILYAKYSPPSAVKILKCLGVGTTNTVDSTTITGLIGGISFVKVGKAANTIFLGTDGGRIYKVPSMNASMAAATLLGTFSGYVSCIDVGVDDNELIVTFSNYNQTSVRYTNNGGTNWLNKDEVAHGLPDVPVRHAQFFPYDRKKVVLATELGVYYSADITAANPAWTDARASASGNNLGNVSCYWLEFRKSDGMLVVGTHGRGVYFSDYFKSQVPLVLTFTSTILNNCPSGVINVSFDIQGDFGAQTFTAQLSNSTGSFASPVSLGAVTPSTNTLTLPVAANGMGYKVRVVASGGTISTESNSFAIQTITFNNSTPSLVTAHNNGGIIKFSTTAATTVYWVAVPDAATAPTATQIILGQNAAGVSTYAGNFAINTASTNRYLDISVLQPGQAFDVYAIAQSCSNTTPVKIDLTTTGNNANYCAADYSNGCSPTAVIISRAKLAKGTTTLFDRQDFTCTNNSLFPYLQSLVQPNDALTFNTEHWFNSGGSTFTQNLSVWVDYNRDGVFGNSAMDPSGTERVYSSNLASGGFSHTGNFTIPANTAPGLLRIRFRSQFMGHGQVVNPCTSYAFGEAEDYVIWVGPTITTSNLGFTAASPNTNVSIPFTTVGSFNVGNAFTTQVAPVATGAFVNQTTVGTTSPLTTTLGAGLTAGEYIVRVVSSNAATNGSTSLTSFIITNCPSQYVLTGNVSSGSTKYETVGFIESTQSISSTAQIKYDATTHVTLNPGFSAAPNAGGYFTAYIDGCGGAYRIGIPDSAATPTPKTPVIVPTIKQDVLIPTKTKIN